jgi:hypothetical protein
MIKLKCLKKKQVQSIYWWKVKWTENKF